jgi:hypothetical protein
VKREPGTPRRQARSRRRRGRTFKLTPLGEIVVDIGTVVVAAIAFAPEIAAALASLKEKQS